MDQPALFAVSGEDDYPEINHGVWTFNVSREVRVTTWSGQPKLGEDYLAKLAPKCHYNELPHGEEDITMFHGKKAGAEWAYVVHDNQTDISEYDVVFFYLPFVMRTDWRVSLPA